MDEFDEHINSMTAYQLISVTKLLTMDEPYSLVSALLDLAKEKILKGEIDAD